MAPRLPGAPRRTAPTGRVVAGVDGCRAGWVVATADAVDGRLLSVGVVASIAPVLADDRIAAVAVDMPIGLPVSGPRACDREARALLGPRRASVFPAPARAVLGARDHTEATARSRAAIGRGLSLQTWHLVPKVAELDAAMDPSVQQRVREAHPELAFARLLGHPPDHPKRTADGRRERIAALTDAVPGTASGGPWASPPAGAAPDDVLDAVVLTTVARRMSGGPVSVLGDGSTDARGLRAEIVW